MKTPSPAVKHGSKINTYVRHNPKCDYRQQRYNNSRCGCPLWFQWTQPDGNQWKESAKTRDWKEAQARAHIIETGEVPASVTKSGSKLVQSIKAAAQDYYDTGLKAGTFKKERASTIRLMLIERQRLKNGMAAITPMAEYFVALGKLTMNELNNASLKTWWHTWKFKEGADGGPSTSLKTRTGLVNTFLRWAHEQGYTTVRLSLPSVKVSAQTLREEQGEPFTPAEYNRILATIDRMPSRYWDDEKKQRVRGLIYLQRWGGLRILDAVTLAHESIDAEGHLFRYMEKTDNEVRVTLPPEIAEYLRMVPNSNPKYILWDGQITAKSEKSNYERALRSLFKKAGIVDGHSHRFRHTFAVEHLLAGTSLEQVSKLLGHTKLKTTEQYYSKWTKDRYKTLESAERASWEKQQARLDKAVTATAAVQ